MYPNKLTTSSTCHQFVLNQQDCRVGPCKNKNNTYVNIQKYVESKIIIQVSNQFNKFQKWVQINKYNPLNSISHVISPNLKILN